MQSIAARMQVSEVSECGLSRARGLVARPSLSATLTVGPGGRRPKAEHLQAAVHRLALVAGECRQMTFSHSESRQMTFSHRLTTSSPRPRPPPPRHCGCSES
eukprot:68562-Rhodomonas_salina.1